MIAAAILVGGRSVRMGRDKAGLAFHGRPLLPALVARLAAEFDRVLLIGRPGQTIDVPGAEHHVDRRPDGGSLTGLSTALRAGGASRLFVVACDHPLLDARFARRLVDEPGDAVVPVIDGFEQPLHAVYAPACQGPIEQALDRGEWSVRGRWRTEVQTRLLEHAWTEDEAASMRSANTPEAWAALEAGLKAGAAG